MRQCDAPLRGVTIWGPMRAASADGCRPFTEREMQAAGLINIHGEVPSNMSAAATVAVSEYRHRIVIRPFLFDRGRRILLPLHASATA